MFPLDTRKNKDIVGTGLGLSITRRLVELMGGNISVESEYGHGTTFHFYITCPGEHSGHLAEVFHPAKHCVLFYEPDSYQADSLMQKLDALQVAFKACSEPAEFQAQIKRPEYTHILFDSSARSLFFPDSLRADVHYIIIKEVFEKTEDDFSNVLNRPIIITSLADLLNGGQAPGSAISPKGEITIGAFQTKDARILIVDDNNVNLMVAEGLVGKYGIATKTALSGLEALELVQKEDYDLIFMDHMMPKMDGIETTKAIRRLGGVYQKLPIIALSANAVTGAKEFFLAAGMDDFLSKPILVKQLHHMLLDYLPAEKVISS